MGSRDPAGRTQGGRADRRACRWFGVGLTTLPNKASKSIESMLSVRDPAGKPPSAPGNHEHPRFALSGTVCPSEHSSCSTAERARAPEWNL